MESVNEAVLELLESEIRNIPDFPKPGIDFKDITPLLKNPDTLELTSQMLARPFRHNSIDYVVGIESRGFLFGTNLAQDLHAGFIPVRKPGKLPSQTVSQTYALEYGEDKVEMHSDALPDGAKVIIHDDLIATGGSARAATQLVEKLGAQVVGYSFILELEALQGRDLLSPDAHYEVLISV
ncbi:adenine phosphoribosyltransferase [Aliifodinibius sp. S!AR15-10]|uniref:adenine phosphoribosyltransferase n=1 Tax=Aliifodinibius sp. S!AR15-10 TaxID=2950437 RepID=UPI00286127B3|nr:adenine phosphoribosyltransferase [Aliifodinibius sp. S!AR15-10]MDR8390933.1 adenine phosphoribosyltransferase [Aliifodinibius sp. S!AR15-10]